MLNAVATNIVGVSGHEDWVLSQVMMNQGFCIFEVPVFCNHMRKDMYRKWGEITEAWNIYGQHKAGLHPKVKDYFWIPKKGIEFSIRFFDSWYFFHSLYQFGGVVKAIYFPKEFERVDKSEMKK